MTGKPLSGTRARQKFLELNGDDAKGSQIYAQQCALCHGVDGVGKPPAIPALWGLDSYSDGAGMHQIAKMAAFVQHNMPQTDPDSLKRRKKRTTSRRAGTASRTLCLNMKDHM